jgi:DNA (cytosine-5)-methyltransferase 1
MNELTHLDLFSGIGGFALAAKWNGYRTVGFCDNEPYAQAVLKKHWPEVPCHKDIREVRGDLYAGVTLLTGGFPCQPFSVAGKQRGKDDNRYLWPEMLRVIREARPAWIIGENVAGIVNLALDTVCADLEAEGYEVEPVIIPACAVDAAHRRDRVWIIARNVGDTQLDGYAAAQGFGKLLDQPEKQRGQVEERKFAGAGGSPANVANSDRGQLSQREPEGQSVQVSGEGGERVGDVADTISQRRCGGNSEGEYAEDVGQSPGHPWHNPGGVATWLPEPDVGRVAHGVPNRVAKLRGLGNAIVPQVAAEIIRNINIIMEQP